MSIETQLSEVVALRDRFSDRLEVTLWWVRDTLETFVEVTDYKTEPPTNTIVPVPEGTSANMVFDHPFAYAPKLAVGELVDGRGAE